MERRWLLALADKQVKNCVALTKIYGEAKFGGWSIIVFKIYYKPDIMQQSQ